MLESALLGGGGCLLLGGVCSWGVSAGGGLLQGVSALEGCLLQGLSALGGGGGCLLQGVSALVGVSALAGVSAQGGGIPACTEADTPPHCGQNHRHE